ncbi:MAG: acetyl-CoA carboxylase biotin carboxyl carrier protein [Acidobacteria bacterium]|nr:acetyl-CoA carboxylase biotin carboxyl carrier protein [Acidobacteriota bacterium]
MNLKEIRDIVELITEKGIAEFELERSGFRIKISRRSAPAAGEPVFWQSQPPVGMSGMPPPNSQAGPPVGAGARNTLPTPPPSMVPGSGSSSTTSEEVQTIKSPMVGSYYSAPAVGAPPFVEPGIRVRIGQVLCIIEAMKLMNEIESEIEGEVVKCYVENGQPVEFGQPLFDIRPNAAGRKR